MKDRADYARKGIARGRGLVAAVYDDGIVICAENPSSTLRKISEIYDRIAFAGVGKYNEFDQLRIAGVRAADLKGYAYSREDVDARSLANQYASDPRPDLHPRDEADGGRDPGGRGRRRPRRRPALPHPLRRHRHGRGPLHRPRRRGRGDQRPPRGGVDRRARPGRAPCGAAVAALAGPDRTLGAGELEAAVLERTDARRAFRRLELDERTSCSPDAAPSTCRRRQPTGESGRPPPDDGHDREQQRDGDHRRAGAAGRRRPRGRCRPPSSRSTSGRRPRRASPSTSASPVGLGGGHEDLDAADGVEAVDIAAERPDHALGSQAGGHELGLEARPGEGHRDHLVAIHDRHGTGRQRDAPR